jgi:TRAP-type uncharacterized transport system fused permease subunit
MRTAILPFMFIFNTHLLWMGIDSVLEGAIVFFSAVLGMFAFGAGTQRWLMIKTRWYEQIVLLSVAFMLVTPTITTDLIGLGLVLLVFASQWARKRAIAAAPA